MITNNNKDYDKYIKYKYKYIELKKQNMLGGNNYRNIIEYFNKLCLQNEKFRDLFIKWAIGSDDYARYIVFQPFIKDTVKVSDILSIIMGYMIDVNNKIVQFMKTCPYISKNNMMLKNDGVYECYPTNCKKMKLQYEGDIISIYGSDQFSMILTTKGLYVKGSNKYGEPTIGSEYATNRYDFKKIDNTYYDGDILSFSKGESHTLIVTKSGIYGCGSNKYGELGLGHNREQWLFQKINDKDYEGNIISAVCGKNHTAILTTSGLYVCGNNENGQLGLGHNNNQNLLQKIDKKSYGGGNIERVCCGWNSTILSTSSDLYACGNNIYGNLGTGDKLSQNIFKKINKEFNNDDIISIICGVGSTTIFTINGLYISGGLHGFGTTAGLNTFEYAKKDLYEGDIIAVICNDYTSMILTTNGLYVRDYWDDVGGILHKIEYP